MGWFFSAERQAPVKCGWRWVVASGSRHVGPGFKHVQGRFYMVDVFRLFIFLRGPLGGSVDLCGTIPATDFSF